MSPDDLTIPNREQSPVQIPLEEVDQIVSRIAGMREMSATKRIALSTLSSLTAKPQGEAIQPLIGVLADPSLRRWKEREMAAWALGRSSLNDEEKDAAAAALMDVVENAATENPWRRASRYLIHDMAVGFCFVMYMAMRDPWFFIRMPFIPALLMSSVSFLPISLPLSWLYEKTLNDRARVAAAVALCNLAIPETLGALAGALRDRNRALRVAAADALHQVLPTITADDFGKFGSQTITNLALALKYPDGRLVFKLLEALEKVGTGLAVPHVERLARSGRTTKVRDAAGRVVDILRARQHRENQSDRLLRSATSPADPSEVLLRPPAYGNETETLHLLRSSIEEMN